MALGGMLARMSVAVDLSRRLTRTSDAVAWAWLVPVKDLLQAALWVAAFTGNRIEWRGESYRVRADGSLISLSRRT
jgi:hypothetical protein